VSDSTVVLVGYAVGSPVSCLRLSSLLPHKVEKILLRTVKGTLVIFKVSSSIAGKNMILQGAQPTLLS
jgi:hypothetical protein